MHANSSNTNRFLYAAKLAEQKTLLQLSENCRLVTVICNLIHELQKERGVSNVYLASSGIHYSKRRLVQINNSELAQQAMMAILNKQYLESKQNSDNHRLLFSITVCLQGIDDLDALRVTVANHKLSPLESTMAYSRLIGGLISIIFEAADISSDTQLTRQLVALFNFIQAKEYAGKERAWGAIGFADAHFTPKICAQLEQLQQSQVDSMYVFLEYTDARHQKAWEEFNQQEVNLELQKFRQLISQLCNGDPIAPEISEIWYETATKRIDHMRVIESSLSEQLLNVSMRRVNESTDALKSHQQSIEKMLYLNTNSEVTHSIVNMLFHTDVPGFLGINSDEVNDLHSNSENKCAKSRVHKPLYDLLLQQAKRIEEMSGELDTAKQGLLEHKLVSRAKLLLIQQLQLSESEAHQQLQQASMKNSISLSQVAQNIINASKGSSVKS
jgi:hypothetical protein